MLDPGGGRGHGKLSWQKWETEEGGPSEKTQLVAAWQVQSLQPRARRLSILCRVTSHQLGHKSFPGCKCLLIRNSAWHLLTVCRLLPFP